MRAWARTLMLTALAPALAIAADKPPPGTDLLEFLGSVGSEGNDWSEYLGNTDLDRLAKTPAAKKPAAQRAPPTAPPAPTPVVRQPAKAGAPAAEKPQDGAR